MDESSHDVYRVYEKGLVAISASRGSRAAPAAGLTSRSATAEKKAARKSILMKSYFSVEGILCCCLLFRCD